MATINRTAIVSYTPAQMFELVNKVEDYSTFLPWCKESIVHSRDEDEVRASLILAWGGLEKSFTTCNRLQHNKMIEVRLVEGPFHNLEGFWRFEDLGDQACKILLDLEFEFAGKLLSFAFGPIFHQIANTLVDSFCKRAEEVYGKQEGD